MRVCFGILFDIEVFVQTILISITGQGIVVTLSPPWTLEGILDEPRDLVDHHVTEWALQCPEVDTWPNRVLTRLGRLQAFIDPVIDEVHSKYGLTRSSCDVLWALRRQGPPYRLHQHRLMDALMRTSGTVSVLVDRLENEGLVTRVRDPDDNRAVFVCLTPKGSDLFVASHAAHGIAGRRVLASLTDDEAETLAELLRKLLVSFELDHPTSSYWPGATLAARLGIVCAPAHTAMRMRSDVGLPEQSGLLIRDVVHSSPAARAQIRPGDLIIAAQGHEVRTPFDVHRGLEQATSDGRLALTILHGVQERVVTLDIGVESETAFMTESRVT